MHSYRLLGAAAILAAAFGISPVLADDDHGGPQPNDNLPVYLDRNVDATATCSPTQIWQGQGSTVTTFQRKRNLDAGIELAIKGLLREAPNGDIRSTYVDGDGLVHIEVPTGPQPGKPNRAIWNFTYSYDVALDPTNPTLDSYEAELWIDLDPTDKTDYLKLKLAKIGPPVAGACVHDYNGYGWKAGSTIVIGDDEGTDKVTQNSQNLAFYASLIDTDPRQRGIQPYTYGPGQFDVVMMIKSKNRAHRHRDDHGNDATILHVIFDVVSGASQSP